MDSISKLKSFQGTLLRAFHGLENAVVGVLLLLMAVIPVGEWLARRLFQGSIPGSIEYLRHLTLWVGFIGAMLATRDKKHLQILLPFDRLPPGVKKATDTLADCISAFICAGLFGASLELVISEAPAVPESVVAWLPTILTEWLEPFGLTETYGTAYVGGWMPVWVAQLVMPIGFAVMAIRFVLQAPTRVGRIAAFLMIPAIAVLPIIMEENPAVLATPGAVLLLLSAFVGTPIFIVLGGLALLLFWGEMVPVASIPAETYRIVASPIFPTIPLFTLAGFILSEGKSSERLVDVFRTWFGWVPGGMAVATTLLCAFFTTFTGASGVTILALGGLLLPVLLKSGLREPFSVGLLASTGSVGLLLPPSLVVILYGVFAQVPITDMFIASLLPGLLLIGLVCALCVISGKRLQVEKRSFDLNAALRAAWSAKWEVLMPALVLLLIFGGFCTLVEAAAVLVVYALVVECVIYRDFGWAGLHQMLIKCGGLIGGVLIILGVAMGLTSYMVDAEIPMQASAWVSEHVESKWAFLLALNCALIAVGCLMDIYSALVVVVPLLLPMADEFGIDRTHLGVIFLANLQLGYLTPPVGMNLFLASFRFEKPLMYVSKVVLPFLLVMAVVVLLVTYVPILSVGVVEAFR